MRHINKKNVVEISILNSERHLLRFFFHLVSLNGIMLILLFKALDFNSFFFQHFTFLHCPLFSSDIQDYLTHFLSPSSKNKKSPLKRLYFRKQNFQALILRYFLYFIKEALLIFREMETPKKFFIFLGNGFCLYFRKLKP